MNDPITPEVGRHVHYYPFVSHFMEPGPRAAVIAKVHNDRLVNLAVFDQNGVAQGRLNVVLVQEGDKEPNADFCRWMPWQLATAKALEPAAKAAKAAA